MALAPCLSTCLLSISAPSCPPHSAHPTHAPTCAAQANVNTLYVTALNPGVTESDLRNLFSGYGQVQVRARAVTGRVVV